MMHHKLDPVIPVKHLTYKVDWTEKKKKRVKSKHISMEVRAAFNFMISFLNRAGFILTITGSVSLSAYQGM